MRAIVYQAAPGAGRGGPPSLSLDESAPQPASGAGLAVVKPLRTALAADDLRHAPAEPMTPGRRFVAELVDAEPGDSLDETLLERLQAKKGEPTRVTALPSLFCGVCERCKRGLQAHCAQRRELATPEQPGSLAERMTLPIRCLAPVPARVDDDAAAYASLLAEALHATSLLHLEGKSFVTVLGDTPAGLLCAQLMERRNASVRLLGRDEGRLSICERWGVKHRPLGDVGLRGDQDVVVDCTGDHAVMAAALGMLRPRGQLLMCAPAAPGRVRPSGEHAGDPLATIATKELSVVGARGGRLADALRALEREEVDVVSLISRRVPLAEAPAAVRSLAEPGVVSLLVAR